MKTLDFCWREVDEIPPVEAHNNGKYWDLLKRLKELPKGRFLVKEFPTVRDSYGAQHLIKEWFRRRNYDIICTCRRNKVYIALKENQNEQSSRKINSKPSENSRSNASLPRACRSRSNHEPRDI